MRVGFKGKGNSIHRAIKVRRWPGIEIENALCTVYYIYINRILLYKHVQKVKRYLVLQHRWDGQKHDMMVPENEKTRLIRSRFAGESPALTSLTS